MGLILFELFSEIDIVINISLFNYYAFIKILSFWKSHFFLYIIECLLDNSVWFLLIHLLYKCETLFLQEVHRINLLVFSL